MLVGTRASTSGSRARWGAGRHRRDLSSTPRPGEYAPGCGATDGGHRDPRLATRRCVQRGPALGHSFRGRKEPARTQKGPSASDERQRSAACYRRSAHHTAGHCRIWKDLRRGSQEAMEPHTRFRRCFQGSHLYLGGADRTRWTVRGGFAPTVYPPSRQRPAAGPQGKSGRIRSHLGTAPGGGAGGLPSLHDPCTARRGRRVHLGAAGPRSAPGRLRGRGA
ncbi:hypothetical protein SSTG_01738 [Streptomyces sp. e14]|nr:hypothetical protein SSTG_01738 [Streptomyces sp. e14]